MKKKINLTPELERFLKDNRAYSKAVKNTIDSYKIKGEEIQLENETFSHLMVMFTWRNTPEGYVFWSNLDDKFINN